MAMATLHVPRAIALAMMALLAGACSPPMGEGDHELTLPEKVQSSDLVIYGEVRRTYPDPRFDYGSGVSSVYTAEMTVFCVIRGRRTKAVINVTEAGKIAFPQSTFVRVKHSASAISSLARSRT